mgnify:CR=1 FL=1
MSHECTKCKGRLHDFLCSDQLSEELTEMVCKLCDSRMSWTEGNGNEDGKEEWQVQNKKVKKGKKGKNKKTGGRPISIMKMNGGRGRGNYRERNKKVQRRVRIASAKTEPIHEFSVKYNPNVLKKKGFSLQTVIEVVAKTMDKRTGHTATFHPTTTFPLRPNPIKNITDNFPTSLAEVQDFFDVHEINPNNAVIKVALTMPGTTHKALYESMKNTLKQYSLWLSSEELAAEHQDLIAWIMNSNPTYTDPQGQAKQIQEENRAPLKIIKELQ